MAQITLPIDDMRQSLRTALVRSREPITAYVGYSADDPTIDVPGISNLIYIYGVDGQPETATAYFQPIKIPYAALNHRTQITIEKLHGNWWVESVGYEGFLEQLGGGVPETNMLGFVHTHESTLQGGLLDASAIFDAGAVLLEYGGTEADLSGLTTGALIAKGASALGAANLTSAAVVIGNGTGAPTGVAPGTSGNVLTSNGSAWTSAAPSGGGGGWTDDGTVVRLTTSTDNVTIGSAADIAKLGVVGDADEVQLLVRANATQTGAIFTVQNSGSSALFHIEPSLISFNLDASYAGAFTQITGGFIINDDGDDFDSILRGDNDPHLLYLDSGTDRVGIGDDTPDGRFAVVGRADEIQTIIRGNATQTNNILEIQDSASNVQVSVSGLGAAVFNEEGNDADFRIESDTQVNAFFLDGTNGAIQQLGNAPAAFLHMAASTTALASYRVPAGIAPSSPGAGDVWNDTTQQAMRVRMAGMTGSDVLTLFTQTANAGPVGTTTETNLISTGIGTNTLAANYLTVGKRIRVTLRGHYSSNGTARGITFRGKIGAVEFDDVTVTTDAPAAGRNWRAEFTFTTYTTGSSGTCWAHGWVELNDVTGILVTVATTAVNTTTTLALQLSAQWATAPAASTYFTCTECSIEALN